MGISVLVIERGFGLTGIVPVNGSGGEPPESETVAFVTFIVPVHAVNSPVLGTTLFTLIVPDIKPEAFIVRPLPG